MAHPLEKFKYCPLCGSSRFEIHNVKSRKCQDCGFTYYANPSSATVALIVNDKDELLAVRRKNEPAKGTLDLPGGFVDMEETGEQGMAREVMEETGLKVTHLRFFSAFPTCICTQVSSYIPWTCSTNAKWKTCHWYMPWMTRKNTYGFRSRKSRQRNLACFP